MKLFGFGGPPQGSTSPGPLGAGREQSRPALSSSVSRSGVPLTAEWPRPYEAQVREGYCGNAVAQRAVRLVAESVAGAPVETSDPAIAALLQVADGGSPLLEAVAAQMLLHGNAYVQIGVDPDGAPVELWALRPERVAIETDAGGWPAAYRYKVGDRMTRLLAEGPRPEVAHIKFFHPLDDHYGLGCLGAAAAAIQVHNAAARWTRALLDNAARPSGALVHDPGDGSALSPDQFERLKAEMEAGFAGAANAGRPMLLEGGLKW